MFKCGKITKYKGWHLQIKIFSHMATFKTHVTKFHIKGLLTIMNNIAFQNHISLEIAAKPALTRLFTRFSYNIHV